MATTYKSQKQIDSEIKELLKLASKIFGDSEPWNLADVIKKLIEASNILLHDKDYDGHGWEEISHCVEKGKEYLEKIDEYQKLRNI